MRRKCRAVDTHNISWIWEKRITIRSHSDRYIQVACLIRSKRARCLTVIATASHTPAITAAGRAIDFPFVNIIQICKHNDINIEKLPLLYSGFSGAAVIYYSCPITCRTTRISHPIAPMTWVHWYWQARKAISWPTHTHPGTTTEGALNHTGPVAIRTSHRTLWI